MSFGRRDEDDYPRSNIYFPNANGFKITGGDFSSVSGGKHTHNYSGPYKPTYNDTQYGDRYQNARIGRTSRDTYNHSSSGDNFYQGAFGPNAMYNAGDNANANANFMNGATFENDVNFNNGATVKGRSRASGPEGNWNNAGPYPRSNNPYFQQPPQQWGPQEYSPYPQPFGYQQPYPQDRFRPPPFSRQYPRGYPNQDYGFNDPYAPRSNPYDQSVDPGPGYYRGPHSPAPYSQYGQSVDPSQGPYAGPLGSQQRQPSSRNPFNQSGESAGASSTRATTAPPPGAGRGREDDHLGGLDDVDEEIEENDPDSQHNPNRDHERSRLH